jgi:hypothetical protein
MFDGVCEADRGRLDRYIDGAILIAAVQSECSRCSWSCERALGWRIPKPVLRRACAGLYALDAGSPGAAAVAAADNQTPVSTRWALIRSVFF